MSFLKYFIILLVCVLIKNTHMCMKALISIVFQTKLLKVVKFSNIFSVPIFIIKCKFMEFCKHIFFFVILDLKTFVVE